MIVLNFAHPLTHEHLRKIETLTGRGPERVIEIPSQIDQGDLLAPQVRSLADACALSVREWQTLPVLVNPPSLNFSAVALIAELHGRMGYFPAIIRLRPVPNSTPPQFEVAEVINLQQIRDEVHRREVK